MGYAINANLQIGDIILIKSGSKFGHVITKVTKGSFSHASLVVNGKKYIEALTTGVQATSTAQILIENKENIKVLRPTVFSNGLTEEYIKKIVEESNPHRYRKYNFTGAVTSILEKDIKHKEKTYFCSELVTFIYENIGIKLFEKNSAHVTPNDFLDLIGTTLVDVTNDVLSPIPKTSILFQTEIDYLDNGKKTEYKESQLLSNFFKKVEKIFAENNIVITQIGVFELLFIIDDIEDTRLKKILDSEFAKEYKKLNINQHVIDFFSKLKERDLKKYEQDLKQFTAEELIIYLKNEERNKLHNNNKINEFQAYIEVVKKIRDQQYHEFADEILTYFEIYLDITKKVAVEFEKIEELLFARLDELKT